MSLAPTDGKGFLEKWFQLKESGTNVKTEIIAGLTTFVTMAYIIIVNPQILKDAGMDHGAVFVATCLAAAASTLFMGLFANYPFALAPGMGLNAFFAYVMVGKMGLSWQTALGAVFISGCIATVVTATGLRELIIKAIPLPLKHAVSAGIGLFIAFIGFKNAGIVVSDPNTLVNLGNLTGREPLLAIIGLFIIGALIARNVTGGILIGILATTIIGIPLGITKFSGMSLSIPSIAPGFMKLDISEALQWGTALTIFSLFFADLFDTVGTLVGVCNRTNLMDEEGNLKRGNRALFADSLGTVFGALLGTSNTTSYVESAAGVAAGGRTGLTATVTGITFILALVFAPIALAVPGAATAPALIIVGILMASSLRQINFDDFVEAFPSFIIILMMPLTFSIATGLALGFVVCVAQALLLGHARKVHWLMYVLSAFFVIHFTFK
ncbi:MAG: NCS2 family permease [Armatimonadetes bacterium]|nr:NCS2 family permease [Armatimonadota bacterium]